MWNKKKNHEGKLIIELICLSLTKQKMCKAFQKWQKTTVKQEDTKL